MTQRGRARRPVMAIAAITTGLALASISDRAAADPAHGSARSASERDRERRRLKGLGSARVNVNVDGAEITVDDSAVGTSPLAEPLSIAAGHHRIAARKPSFAPVTAVLDIAAGEDVEISLSMIDMNDPAAAGAAAGSPASGSTSAATPSRVPFWIGVGVTSALAVATVTSGILALGAKSDLDVALGHFGATGDEIDHARTKVDRLALVTDVLGGATVVAAGITTFLFFQSQPAVTRVGVGLGGVSLTHNF